MTDRELRLALEAIVTVAIEPVPSDALADLVGHDESQVREVLVDIRRDLAETARGFQLVELASGGRLQSNPAAVEVVQRFASRDLSARLSTAALETLAIVAYRQPVSRAQVATLRGVNVDGVVRLAAEVDALADEMSGTGSP